MNFFYAQNAAKEDVDKITLYFFRCCLNKYLQHKKKRYGHTDE